MTAAAHRRRVAAGTAALVAVALLLLAPATSAEAQDMTPEIVGTSDTWGGGDPIAPVHGLAADAAGNVYVATSGHRIVRWRPGGPTATVVAGGNGEGSGLNQFAGVTDIALLADESLLVADSGNHRILRFPPGSTSATPGVVVAGGNGAGSGPADLSIPSRVLPAPDGSIYVVDSLNQRLQLFPPGSNGTTAATTVMSWDSGTGGLTVPWPTDIALGPDGALYLLHDRSVSRWVPGAGATETVVGPVASYVDLGSPSALVVDDLGNVVISEVEPSRVQVWRQGGARPVVLPGVVGLSEPSGLVADPSGRLYVRTGPTLLDGRWTYAIFRYPAGHPGVFPDVPASRFDAAAIRWAARVGLSGGVGSTGRFVPDAPVTRAEGFTMLWRARGRTTYLTAFPDVAAGSYYASAAGWAHANGLTTGVGGRQVFRPDLVMTRAQAVTLLWRDAGWPVYPDGPRFSDVPADAYFAQAVRWAEAAGVTTGYAGTDEFRPHEPVTRGQLATMLHRLTGGPGA